MYQSSLRSLPLVARGKVRDIYAVGDDKLLLVASDRLSAYDVILPTPIPEKGRVLTQLSNFWFAKLASIVPNHLTHIDPETVVAPDERDQVRGRAVVVKRLTPLPIEAVVRGYLEGSGWKEYQESRTVCGLPLPAGLRRASKLPEPIFTPATKAERGAHDENISYERLAASIGESTAARIKQLTLAVYARAAELALQRGIILADTKLEFGRTDADDLVLGDEVLTPDSSRFWPADDYRPGRAQPSFDKQFVRDWLLSRESGWDRRSGAQPPPLPERIVAATRERYVEAYERLTGLRFSDWPG
jgi:phosphoribosylaminoimidazole-succinocarboxamide synthase